MIRRDGGDACHDDFSLLLAMAAKPTGQSARGAATRGGLFDETIRPGRRSTEFYEEACGMTYQASQFMGRVFLAKRVLATVGAATAIAISVTPAGAVVTNLATLGTATASRTDFGATVEAGIDGNRDGNFGNGSVFYGNADPLLPPLYYEVDLGVDAYIDRVQILRRTDADQGVFGNMRLTDLR